MAIWDFSFLKKEFDFKKYFSLEEGKTSVEEVKLDQGNILIIKREDLNPTGSWKDRASALEISYLYNANIHNAVIASSGNAAISILEYVNIFKELNLKLHIVISPNITKEKKELIFSKASVGGHEVYIDSQAKKRSSKLALETNGYLIKSSANPFLHKAYWSLGAELYADLKKYRYANNIEVFAPVSSGTAIVGLTEGLFLKLESEYSVPKVFVCQSSSCNPIVRLFNPLEDNNLTIEKSFADSIVDQSAIRSPAVLNIIKQTNSDGFTISNTELEKAKNFCLEKGIVGLSYTSLLSIAGVLRVYHTKVQNTVFVAIASGR